MDFWDVNLHAGPFEALFVALFALLKILFTVFIIVLVVRLLRSSGAASPSSSNSSIQILEERYARGEISQDEFQERRAVLRGQS